MNIVNPPYPDLIDTDPSTPLPAAATNKYLLGDINMERIYRYSTAIDRTLTPKLRTSMTFSIARYGNQLRGLNRNAPVNGVRPDPSFANVIEVVDRVKGFDFGAKEVPAITIVYPIDFLPAA